MSIVNWRLLTALWIGFFGLSITMQSTAIDFTYRYGSATEGYTLKGAPMDIVDRSSELPSAILNNIYSMLPESQYVDLQYIDTTLASNLIADKDLKEPLNVQLHFLNEGAGYRNVLGYFIFDGDNPPNSIDDIDTHVIIFPNASKPPQGELAQGHSVDLNIELAAGQGLGFFVVPDGWGWRGSLGYINSMGPWGQAFYSLPELNPEPEGFKQHNVIFYDAHSQLFVVGFEDQHRNEGDNDFNDILFSLDVGPIDAIQGINDDGSVDQSHFPSLVRSQAELTSTVYYPSRQGRATLFFEDLWPNMGDYDFNDLIITYQIKLTLNANNRLIAMQIDFEVQAIGAAYHNGLAMHLPNVYASDVATSSLTQNGTVLNPSILDMFQSEATFILLYDATALVPSDCPMFRTLTGCKESIGSSFTADITFRRPIDIAVLGEPPYDPYIFVPIDNPPHGRWYKSGWEVHLKQFSGSDTFNEDLYGRGDDASSGDNYFINQYAFPWVINLPARWDHPREGVDILDAYPDFSTWVLSAGKQAAGWYRRDNAALDKLYE